MVNYYQYGNVIFAIYTDGTYDNKIHVKIPVFPSSQKKSLWFKISCPPTHSSGLNASIIICTNKKKFPVLLVNLHFLSLAEFNVSRIMIIIIFIGSFMTLDDIYFLSNELSIPGR